MNSGRFYAADPWLNPFTGTIENRIRKCISKEKELTGDISLSDFACGHHYYGLHKTGSEWIFREWAPNATGIFITGTFTGWKETDKFKLKKISQKGDWEIILPRNVLKHGDLYKLSVHWENGRGERIPSYANRVIQDDNTKIFSAQIWEPESPYKWKSGKLISVWVLRKKKPVRTMNLQ
jgi:1,4-alpha-glucan branching enzyme